MRSVLDGALEYHELGWSVVPLLPKSKKPHFPALMQTGRSGKWQCFQTESASEAEIRAWFEFDPGANLGLVLGAVSGIVVADFDRGEMPQISTPTVRTSRGAHLYLSSSGTISTRAFSQGELKAEGGYVVAPPSIHDNGHVYEWTIPLGSPLASFEAVHELLGIEAIETKPGTGSRLAAQAEASLTPSTNVPELRLSEREQEYMRLRPGHGEREELGFGEVEHGLVCRLVNQDYADSEIAAWFQAYQPPKYAERGDGWLLFSISNARATKRPSRVDDFTDDQDEGSSFSTNQTSLCLETGHISEPDNEDSEDDGPRRSFGWQVRRWLILKDLPEGLRVGELESQIKETFQVGRTQATEDLRWLFETGWLTSHHSEADRRVKIVARTEKADKRLATWHGIGTPLPFLRGLGTKQAETKASFAVPNVALTETNSSDVNVTEDGEVEASRVEDMLADDRAEERRRERSLINDTFRIHFGGRPTYIQLLTHPDDSRKALFHEQLRVGYDENGLTVRRSFVSPRDEGLSGPDAPDPIGDRVLADGGYPPAEKHFAWAVELRKTKHGFEIATRPENGQEVANVGLIVQATTNFFLPISEIPDVTNKVVKVVRKKRKKKIRDKDEQVVSYECGDAGGAPPIGYDLPELDTFLTEMAVEAFADETLESLPDNWRLVKKLPWQLRENDSGSDNYLRTRSTSSQEAA